MTSIQNALLILLVICNHWMSLAIDVCNNRCQQFKYVYCNEQTAICENCNIYCEEESQFYSAHKCQSLGCLDEPVVLDACSNRCLDFPMTYCNEGTGVCDPCEIWCSKDSVFFDVTKCTKKCPGMVSHTPVVLSAVPSEMTSTINTTTTSRPTRYSTAPVRLELSFNANVDTSTNGNSLSPAEIIGISAASASFVLFTIIVALFIRRWRNKNNSLQSSYNGENTPLQESPVNSIQSEGRSDTQSGTPVTDTQSGTPVTDTQSGTPVTAQSGTPVTAQSGTPVTDTQIKPVSDNGTFEHVLT